MKPRAKATPFVPTEIHAVTVEDDKGKIGILSLTTTEGIVEIAIDGDVADAIVQAIRSIRSKLEPRT